MTERPEQPVAMTCNEAANQRDLGPDYPSPQLARPEGPPLGGLAGPHTSPMQEFMPWASSF